MMKFSTQNISHFNKTLGEIGINPTLFLMNLENLPILPNYVVKQPNGWDISISYLSVG